MRQVVVGLAILLVGLGWATMAQGQVRTRQAPLVEEIPEELAPPGVLGPLGGGNLRPGGARLQAPGASMFMAPPPPPIVRMPMPEPEAPQPVKLGNFQIGAGLLVLQPFFNNNPAFAVTLDQKSTLANGKAQVESTTVTEDFSYGYSVLPKIFMGYSLDSGLGFRATWWHYDQSAEEISLANPSQPGNPNNMVSVIVPHWSHGGEFLFSPSLLGGEDYFSLHSDLELDVWDFDVTQGIQWSKWYALFGAGLRYAHISQGMNAFQSTFAPNNDLMARRELYLSNTFNGVGPTLVMEGKRQLGNTGFFLYGNGRGGLLFGTGQQTSFSINVFGDNVDRVNSQISQRGSRDDLISFLEGEAGVEWLCLHLRGCQPFGRLGLAGQSWFGTGNASSTPGSTFGNLGFFGLTFSGGVRF